MGKVIQMENISWKRQGKEILHSINWEVKKGEHWSILGLNGAGKTSLLNMVNGYIWPTTGNVTVLGNDFGQTNIHEMRKTIGWVSSSLGAKINGRHLAEEIVVSGKFAASLLFEEPDKETLAEACSIMKQLGIEHLYGQAYEKCSHGEKQKILISRGLMPKPKLLILDEPTSGLDFIAREELLQSIEAISMEEDAPTIIFVTHHVEEILPVFSHTLLLKDGTVFAKGEREAVLTNENMTNLYGKEIQVDWQQNRAWMTLV